MPRALIYIGAAIGIVVVVVLLAWLALGRLAEAKKHQPTEYFLTFAGYKQPLRLRKRVHREEAEAAATYYIGSFNKDGKLTRAIKMLHGAVAFDFNYTYYPNGKLKSFKSTNADGSTIMREFDESGHARQPAP